MKKKHYHSMSKAEYLQKESDDRVKSIMRNPDNDLKLDRATAYSTPYLHSTRGLRDSRYTHWEPGRNRSGGYYNGLLDNVDEETMRRAARRIRERDLSPERSRATPDEAYRESLVDHLSGVGALEAVRSDWLQTKPETIREFRGHGNTIVSEAFEQMADYLGNQKSNYVPIEKVKEIFPQFGGKDFGDHYGARSLESKLGAESGRSLLREAGLRRNAKK